MCVSVRTVRTLSDFLGTWNDVMICIRKVNVLLCHSYVKLQIRKEGRNCTCVFLDLCFDSSGDLSLAQIFCCLPALHPFSEHLKCKN